jgi:hypothetical protein
MMLLTALGNLTFSMGLSTFFSDSKLANQVGSILLILPVAIYFNIVNGKINNNRDCFPADGNQPFS